MPTLELKTNVKVADPKAFVVEFSQFAAELLGKPIAYICVSYEYKEYLAWNTSFDPAFILAIVSLDNINPAANEKYSAALFDFIKDKLGVPNDRGYISFTDPGRAYLGHQGTTFKTIFG